MADKVTLPTNITVTVQFLRDDCKYSNHAQYGDSFSHFVNAAYPDGLRIERGTLRATPKLHDALLQAGCGKMAVVEITKKEVSGNKIEWQVALRRNPEAPGFTVKPWEEGGQLPGQPQGESYPPAPKADPRQPQGHPFQGNEPAITLADLVYFYEECLIAAQMTVPRILGEAVSLEAIKDVATTFFIEGNKRKLPLPKPRDEEDGEPMESEKPPGHHAGADDDLPF